MAKRKVKNTPRVKTKKALLLKESLVEGNGEGDVAINQPVLSTGPDVNMDELVQHNCQAEAANTQSITFPAPMQSYEADFAPNQGMLYITKQDHIVKESCNTDAPSKLFSIQVDATPIQPESPSTLATKKPAHCYENDLLGEPALKKKKIEEPLKGSSDATPNQELSILTKSGIHKKKQSVKENCPTVDAPSQLSITTELKGDYQDDVAIDVTNPSSPVRVDGKSGLLQETSVVHQLSPTCRLTTSDMPPVVDELLFSPNTVNEVRSTIRALFPNGPPPAPIIPVKRRKKRGVPYIVGCKNRRRVAQKLSLNVFKGDSYGITSDTNSLNNESCKPKKRLKRTRNATLSHSRFNPKSDEIAARLKLNDKVMTTSRSQASPLPSTSKDIQTIMKNDQHFSESLSNDNIIYDISDDGELPDILWEAKGKNTKKTHKSLLKSKDLEIINKSVPLVKNDVMNNNNNIDIPFQEIDFCGIQFNQVLKDEETIVPINRSNSPVIIDEKNVTNDSKPKICESLKIADTIEIKDDIDETILNIENVTNDSKPKICESLKITDTIEIKDDYSSITYEDLYSVPKTTEVVDVDEFFAEFNAFKDKHTKKMNQPLITIVDHVVLVPSVSGEEITNKNLVTAQEPKVQEAVAEVSSKETTSAAVIEIPDTVGPIIDMSNCASTSRDHSTYLWNEEVEFVNETPLNEDINRGLRVHELGLQSNGANNVNIAAASSSNDIQIVDTDPFSGQNIENIDKRIEELKSLCALLTGTRSKKSKRRTPKQQSGQWPVVSNENAAPSANAQTTQTNGERRLGDCPICMENLSNKFISSTTCGHVFCLDCIKTCLRTNGKKCPTCRKKLTGTGYHQVFL